jgi:hypothetical protein
VSALTEHATTLREHADAIRELHRNVIGNILEIGRRLIEVKKLLGHGNFLPWVEAEFQWSAKTAENYMRAAEAFGDKFETVSNLPITITALYELSAPDVPPEARAEAMEIAKTGKPVKKAAAKTTIANHTQKRASVQSKAAPKKATPSKAVTLVPPPKPFSRKLDSVEVAKALAPFVEGLRAKAEAYRKLEAIGGDLAALADGLQNLIDGWTAPAEVRAAE